MINTFAHSERLWLLLPILGLWTWTQWKQNPTTLSVSTPQGRLPPANPRARYWVWSKRALQVLILTVLVALLSQPQHRWQEKEVTTHGVDIVIALDTSGSMAAEDLKGNRLSSAKKVAAEFIANRPNDRLGLVVFGNQSFTRCPVTLDHDVLLNQLKNVELKEAGDATAVGTAIVTALNRLRDSDAKKQAIILVTDGESNAGSIGPPSSSRAGAGYGHKDLRHRNWLIRWSSDPGG